MWVSSSETKGPMCCSVASRRKDSLPSWLHTASGVKGDHVAGTPCPTPSLPSSTLDWNTSASHFSNSKKKDNYPKPKLSWNWSFGKFHNFAPFPAQSMDPGASGKMRSPILQLSGTEMSSTTWTEKPLKYHWSKETSKLKLRITSSEWLVCVKWEDGEPIPVVMKKHMDHAQSTNKIKII